jgi:hypothetical protein
MGYFSNGSEGMNYEEKYCEHCQNWRLRKGEMIAGCPVWDLHYRFNTEQLEEKNVKEILETLIPKAGVWNDTCAMYLPNKSEKEAIDNIWKIKEE